MTLERLQYYAFQSGKEEGYEDGKADGREEGVTEGERKKALDATTNLLHESVPPEIVAKCLGLSLDQVLEIKEKIEKLGVKKD